MKRLFWTVSAGFLMLVSLRADEFSTALSPEDFSAAGLSKLSPQELAHLDALVRAQREGKAKTVARESAVTTTAKPAAVVSPARPATERPSVSPEGLATQKREEVVVIAPGTKVSYREVETQMAGNFHGYEVGSVLTLANGQRWVVTSGSYWTGTKEVGKPRKVVIKTGALGSFFLEIEDGGRPKVKLLDGNSHR